MYTSHWLLKSVHLQGVGYEVRAGLSSVYEERGGVADDIHSESASRTLDYACTLFDLASPSAPN